MKNYLFLGLLSLLLLSCDGTFVTKNVLDSRNFEFVHAGKPQKVLIELKEIRTMTRRNGFFRPGPVQKNVSYDYALYASVNSSDGLTEIYEYPCEKDLDLDDVLSELKIEHSKDRSHYAIGYKGETVGIFNYFKRVAFLADYPLNPEGFAHSEFKKLDLNKLDSPREALKKHISGEYRLLVTDKQLYLMLAQLPPTDELNYELSFSIANEDMFYDKTYQEAIIKHCKKDKNWKANALRSIKNKKDGLSNEQFLSRLHLIGGMEEVVKEDEFQYKLFKSGGGFDYFEERLENTEVLFPQKIKVKLVEDMTAKLTKPCSMTDAECRNMEEILEFSEKLGIDEPFKLFFKNYQQASCLKSTLYKLNDEFLFPSPFRISGRLTNSTGAGLIAGLKKKSPVSRSAICC